MCAKETFLLTFGRFAARQPTPTQPTAATRAASEMQQGGNSSVTSPAISTSARRNSGADTVQ